MDPTNDTITEQFAQSEDFCTEAQKGYQFFDSVLSVAQVIVSMQLTGK